MDETDPIDAPPGGLSPLSAGEVALGSLLDGSHTLHPDDIAAAVARRAGMIGAANASVWVVDRQQYVLTELGGEGGRVEVNRSLAGRAFRTTEVVLAEPPAGAGGRRRAYFPLIDGTERVGILAADLASADAVTLGRVRQLAALAAHLVASKQTMGDGPVVAARARPMTVAAELRWAMMPPLTFATGDVVISGALEPAYDVAGDCFDYAVSGDVLHFAVFDAMGHGLTAARMANLAVVAYRNARRRDAGLVETARFVQETLVGQFGVESTFTTGAFGRLSLSTGRLWLLNAGHPRPLLLRGMRSTTELEVDRGLPLGVGEVAETVLETSLEPGDGLLFYSDGVTEARSPDGEEFGVDRLADLLVRAAASGETSPELMRRLTHAVLEHQADELQDDATLLLVRWRP
jgi:serine phosphatase RsbU (regulator of sigma subunit)